MPVAVLQSDLSIRACVQDLQAGNWKHLAYQIQPSDAAEHRHTRKQLLYVIPATGSVVGAHGTPAANQQRYQQWMVPGIDYWADNGVVSSTGH